MPGPTVGRAEVDVHADLSPFRRELRLAADRAGRDYGGTLSARIDENLRKTANSFDRLWGSSLRGSRNDFLNFVGIVSESFEKLVGRTIGGGLGRASKSFSDFGKLLERIGGPLRQYGEDFRRFGNDIQRFGSGGLDGLIIQVAGLAIGFQGLVVTAGVTAAAISGLAAATTALAVGIGGSLLGGLVSLAPALAAAAAGVSVLALGFSDLSSSEKALFKPLQDLFNETRDAVQARLFDNLGSQASGLATALKPVTGVLEDVADVFSKWVSDVVADIGPGGPLQDSFDTLGREIPSLLETLLEILSNVGGSVTGLFAGATPAAQRFLDKINDLVGDFNEWINSVEGQEALNDFLQDALDLLDSLSVIVSEVGESLGKFWEQGGSDAAQKLLDNIGELVTEFNEWLDTEEGRQALLDFFDNGVRLVEDLGGVVDSLLDLFDELDTAFSRESLSVFLGLLEDGIDLITSWVENVNNFITDLGEFFDKLSTGVEDFEIFGVGVEDVTTKVGSFIDKVGEVAGSLDSTMISDWGSDFRDTLSDAFDTVTEKLGEWNVAHNEKLIDASTAFANFTLEFSNTVDDIETIITTFTSFTEKKFGELQDDVDEKWISIKDSIRDRVADISTELVKLVGKAQNAKNQLNAAWDSLLSKAKSAFSNLPSTIASGINKANSEIKKFATNAPKYLSDLPGRLRRLGTEMMQGLLNGINSKVQSILNTLSNLARRASSTFASVLRISSPSKVFAEYGQNIVDGLVQGIDGGLNEASQAVKSLADATMFSNLNTPISRLGMNSSPVGSSTRSPVGYGDITIVTPYADPRLVALETMDALAELGR